jgi:UDPglucose 6-dehydrogenase
METFHRDEPVAMDLLLQCDNLLHEQAKIAIFDPKVSQTQILSDLDYLNSRSSEENKNGINTFSDPYKACENTHAIAILTEWDEFKNYDWQRIYNNMNKPAFIFDGRNLLNGSKLEEIGFMYYQIGVGK